MQTVALDYVGKPIAELVKRIKKAPAFLAENAGDKVNGVHIAFDNLGAEVVNCGIFVGQVIGGIFEQLRPVD